LTSIQTVGEQAGETSKTVNEEVSKSTIRVKGLYINCTFSGLSINLLDFQSFKLNNIINCFDIDSNRWGTSWQSDGSDCQPHILNNYYFL